MTVGTALFHILNTQAFSRIDRDISELQDQVSSGKNDPRFSADLERGQRLSVANEQKVMIDRFKRNGERAQARIAAADSTFDSMTQIMQRFNELAIQGGNATVSPSDRQAMSLEAERLRESLYQLANTRDESGRPLFGGYLTEGNAFIDGPNGVEYRGDGGQIQMRLSENAVVQTNLTGEEIFLSVEDQNGQKRNVFDMIDDLIRTFASDGAHITSEKTRPDSMTVQFDFQRQAEKWSFDITGTNGTAHIQVNASADNPEAIRDAINAVQAETGVTATLSDDRLSVVIKTPGDVSIANVATVPDRNGVLASVPNDDGTYAKLVSKGRTATDQITAMSRAAEHMSNRRTEIGAMGAAIERYQDVLLNREQILDAAISGLEDLDLAKAITNLQKLLVNRDAAHQTFVKIGQKTLFDFIR